MADPVSDADLQKKQARVAKLREQVAEAEATRVSREREQQNAIIMAQLEAEEAALEAQLAASKAAASAKAVAAGAAPVLDAAAEQKAVAEQQGAAAVVTPTTGEGS